MTLQPHLNSDQAHAVRLLQDADHAAWQEFVDNFPSAGCMHHLGWYNVLRDAYWVTPYFLMATDALGRLRGVLPLYHSRSLILGSHLASLEGGMLTVDDEAARVLIEKAHLLRNSTGARYLLIRGGPINQRAPVIQPTVHTVIETARPQDELWMAIKKKTRWAIRQAEKTDTRVERDPSLAAIEDFYRVYAHHMRDLGTPVMGIDAFRAIRMHLGRERLRLYLVRESENLIGGMLCIINADRWTNYYAVMRPSIQSEFANYLLYWHVIRDASACGVSRFDLGRSTPESNVHLFKRKWGGLDLDVPYYFYPAPNVNPNNIGLLRLKQGKGLPQRIWSSLPLAVCNRLGPLLRKQLPFI